MGGSNSRNYKAYNETEQAVAITAEKALAAVQDCSDSTSQSNALNIGSGCSLSGVTLTQTNSAVITTACTQDASLKASTTQDAFQTASQTASAELADRKCSGGAGGVLIAGGAGFSCSIPSSSHVTLRNRIRQLIVLQERTRAVVSQTCLGESSGSNVINCTGGSLSNVVINQSNYVENVKTCAAKQSLVVESYQSAAQSAKQDATIRDTTGGMGVWLVIIALVVGCLLGARAASRSSSQQQQQRPAGVTGGGPFGVREFPWLSVAFLALAGAFIVYLTVAIESSLFPIVDPASSPLALLQWKNQRTSVIIAGCILGVAGVGALVGEIILIRARNTSYISAIDGLVHRRAKQQSA